MRYLSQRGYTWQLNNMPQQFIQSLVPFLLVFLFLQWEWLGKQISQLSTSSFHPCYKFHTPYSQYVATREGLSFFFSYKKQQKEIQWVAGDHKESQFPGCFIALRNNNENMFGAVQKQVPWLHFQYSSVLKKKKINKWNAVDGKQMYPSHGTGQITMVFRVVHAARDAYTKTIINSWVFSCIGEGRRKPAVVSNVLMWPGALWFNNAAIKGNLLSNAAVSCFLGLTDLYFSWQFWPFPVICRKFRR